MKDQNEMTRKEFEALPLRENWQEEIICDSLVILPTRKNHDSGYKCLDFVACSKDKMFRLSGCSDVMHVDGIGGYGDNWLQRYGKCPTAVHPIGWSIDCLKSGLLRIFAHSYQIKCGRSLSSFEFWAIPRPEEIERRKKFENAFN